jgi:hypothetical protein
LGVADPSLPLQESFGGNGSHMGEHPVRLGKNKLNEDIEEAEGEGEEEEDPFRLQKWHQRLR